MDAQDPDIKAVASEIERYLNRHPNAADMMENIARWWILRQRVETALSITQEALDHLEANGVVERSPQGLYRLAASRQTPVSGPPPANGTPPANRTH